MVGRERSTPPYHSLPFRRHRRLQGEGAVDGSGREAQSGADRQAAQVGKGMEDASELLDRSGEAMAAGRSRRFSGFLDKLVAAPASLPGLSILLYVGDLFSALR